MQPTPVPDLVPARMINEVLYCERLMYLEWSQTEWADNLYTEHGKSVHRRVDKPGRAISEPDDDAPAVARSVWLSSERLGITAKIDLVEHQADGTVMPVEYKRGRRAPVPEQVYLPERAQLCAQILLLRESGYDSPAGIVYFAGERRRVDVAATEELVATTLQAVARARELAEAGRLPPPLVDSPKCPACSLAPICLPEEVNALARGPDKSQSPRLLYPRRDDRKPLYVQEHGTRIGLDGETLAVKTRDGERSAIPIFDTSHVCLFGNVQVSTQALRVLMRRGIPVAFYTTGGWLTGRAVGHDSNNVELRIAQYRAAERGPFRVRLARRLIESKIRNSRTLLRRNSRCDVEMVLAGLKRLARLARSAESCESLLGVEGSAARFYFGEFSSMLDPQHALDFDMNGRNRRPPRDRVNALLSLAYSLLAKDVSIALSHVGLDPMLGYYHRPRFGRPALALDLMEEFRPIVADSVVVTAINTGVISASDFTVSPVGVSLRSAGRKKFIAAYERRLQQLVTHPVFGYRLSYRRVLEVQARLFGRLVLGELKEYPTIQTR